MNPTDIKRRKASRLLVVSFDDGDSFDYSFEYLRVHSPSAEVQGHSADQRVLQTGKENVAITAIEMTLANTPESRGAGIAVFTRRGDLLAMGQLSPGGWRHLLGVAPIGPAGEIEVVDIQKPHVQKIVNFYRPNGAVLNVVAHATSYSSHNSGSTNIYMSLMGDFDGDPSNVELLVPDADKRLVKILARRLVGKVDELGSLDPGGVLSTNFSWIASQHESFFAIGTENKELRIWRSKIVQ